MKRAGLQGGDAFADQRPAAVDETGFFGAVFERFARDVVVVGLVRLAEIGRVGVGHGALLLHPVQRGAGIEAAGKSDADFLADRQAIRELQTSWNLGKSFVLRPIAARRQNWAAENSPVRQTAEQHQQQSLLRVHAILGLIEDDGLRPVENGIGDFGIAMRGQAVHEDRVRRSVGHQRFIDLIGLEDGRALGGLVLEAHAGADVGVDRIGPGDRRDWIVDQSDVGRRYVGDCPAPGRRSSALGA